MSDIKGKISKVESGNSYTAVNKASNASGRYQFVRSTWEGLGYDWKDRFNPQLQEEAMTKLTNINKNEFRKRFGTDPSDADSYGLHFLGVAGYSKVKKADPNTPMSQLITGKAYDYNKNVFEKNGKPITVAQFNDWLTKKMNVKPSETTQQYNNQQTQPQQETPYIPLDLNLPEMTGMTFDEEEKETEEKPQVNKREENANKLSFISDVKELQKQQQEQAYQPPQFLEQQLVEGVAYQPIQQNFQEGGYYFQQGGTWERQQQELKAERDVKLRKLLKQGKPVYKEKTLEDLIAEKEIASRQVKKDNTNVVIRNSPQFISKTARNKTDKEVAEERKAIREKSDANVLNSWSLDGFKPSNYTRENVAEMAQGLESKFRVSDEPNFFDDYLNPANMIGGMAANLGQAPLRAQQTNSYMPYVTAVGTPLAVGAMAGLGTQNTGQFVNNLVNPLAGTTDLAKGLYNKVGNSLDNLGNKLDDKLTDIFYGKKDVSNHTKVIDRVEIKNINNLKKQYKDEFESKYGKGYSDKDLELYVKLKEVEKAELNNIDYDINEVEDFIDRNNISRDYSPKDKLLADIYTKGYDSSLNRRVKEGVIYNRGLYEDIIPQFENLILKNKLKNEEILYRGNNDFLIKDVWRGGEKLENIKFSDLQKGDEYAPNSFYSTSLDKNIATSFGEVASKIEAPKGQSVFVPNATKSGNFPTELEVVLPEKLRYRVDEVYEPKRLYGSIKDIPNGQEIGDYVKKGDYLYYRYNDKPVPDNLTKNVLDRINLDISKNNKIKYKQSIVNPYVFIPPIAGATYLSTQEENTPQYQQGGIKVDPQGYWNPENLGSPVIIEDQEGQRKYPNKITKIKGNIMSTEGYGDIPLYVIPNVGEPKLIFPNTGTHFFPKATDFIEYPIKIKDGK